MIFCCLLCYVIQIRNKKLHYEEVLICNSHMFSKIAQHWKNGESGKWNEQDNVILRKQEVFLHPKHHKMLSDYHGCCYYITLCNIISQKTLVQCNYTYKVLLKKGSKHVMFPTLYFTNLFTLYTKQHSVNDHIVNQHFTQYMALLYKCMLINSRRNNYK